MVRTETQIPKAMKSSENASPPNDSSELRPEERIQKTLRSTSNGAGLKIVFCLPGNSFSGRFLECWSETLGSLRNLGIEVALSRKYSCNYLLCAHNVPGR